MTNLLKNLWYFTTSQVGSYVLKTRMLKMGPVVYLPAITGYFVSGHLVSQENHSKLSETPKKPNQTTLGKKQLNKPAAVPAITAIETHH